MAMVADRSRLRSGWGCLLVATAGWLAVVGCGPSDPAAVPVIRATTAGPPEPGAIELYEPRAHFGPDDVLQFEVKYRFTSGGPTNFYCAEVQFPGSESFGVKYMEGWELKPEGTLRDGLILQSPDVEDFEIRVTEALLPQDGYKPISNVVRGKVEPRSSPAAAEAD